MFVTREIEWNFNNEKKTRKFVLQPLFILLKLVAKSLVLHCSTHWMSALCSIHIYFVKKFTRLIGRILNFNVIFVVFSFPMCGIDRIAMLLVFITKGIFNVFWMISIQSYQICLYTMIKEINFIIWSSKQK